MLQVVRLLQYCQILFFKLVRLAQSISFINIAWSWFRRFTVFVKPPFSTYK